MDFASFIPLITVLVIIAAVVVAVLAIRARVQSFSRQIFGTSSLLKGYNEQKKKISESPLSVRSMTSIYLPQIHRDFPEFDYELYKQKAQAVLRSYFTAVSSKNVLALAEECSGTLKNSVTGIIEDLERRNVTQHFDENVIHDVQIARYIKDGATVTVLFNAAVGQYSYLEDENGKIVLGSRDIKHQTIYDVALVYVQDARKMGVGVDSAIGLNCPNCGAPIRNLGQKFCEHCGSGVIEANTRVWSFDSVKEQTKGKTAY